MKHMNVQFMNACEFQNDRILEFAHEELTEGLETLMNQTEIELSVVFSTPEQPLRFDGYQASFHSGQLRIEASCPRGFLHGAYEILRFLGWDYTFPGRERQIVLRHLDAGIPEFSFRREPWMEYRGACLYNTTKETWKETLNAVDWMAKNGYNFLLTSYHRLDDTGQGDHAILWDEIGDQLLPEIQKRGIVLDMSEHSTDCFFPREELFTQHPEWFALKDGQRQPLQICYSNLQAVDTYGDRLAAFAADKPWFQFMGIWPLDGGGYCECEACRDPLTIYRANVRISQKLAQVRPDLTVEHLAYTAQSFTRPKNAVPKNMSVLVCSAKNEVAYEWAQRAGASGGAFYFDYNTGDHYRFRSLLWLNPLYCQEIVNAMTSYGFRGIVSLYLPVTAWWQASINYWYLRQFYYEPDADVELLTRELAGTLFGAPAAEEMKHILLQVFRNLQDPILWNGIPHGYEWFKGRIVQRNRSLDATHRQRYETVYKDILFRIGTCEISGQREQRNVQHLMRYLHLQHLYFVLITQYDADYNGEDSIEPYLCALKEYESDPDNPYISERYARWRIMGRDNILLPDRENFFQARMEPSD